MAIPAQGLPRLVGSTAAAGLRLGYETVMREVLGFCLRRFCLIPIDRAIRGRVDGQEADPRAGAEPAAKLSSVVIATTEDVRRAAGDGGRADRRLRDRSSRARPRGGSPGGLAPASGGESSSARAPSGAVFAATGSTPAGSA